MARNKEFDYTEKLEIVRNLFWEKGYHATSMHDIVASMKLNRSSIYDTYGNKHELFLKCLNNYADLKKNQYLSASVTKGNAIEVLNYIVHDVVKQTLLDNKACMIVNTIFEMTPSDSEVRKLLIKKGTELQYILETVIKQAQLNGDIISNTEAGIIARYILSSFSSYWSHYNLTQNQKEVIEMVHFFMEQLVK